MTKSLEDFSRALDRAIGNPDLLPEFLEAAADIHAVQGPAVETIQQRVTAAVDALSQRPENRPSSGKGAADAQSETDDCLDLITLTPGGVVQNASEPSRRWIEQILSISIAPNRKLALLEDPAARDAFRAVRDGKVRAQWLTRANAEICFATANTKAASEGMLGRAPIIFMVKSSVPRGRRHDRTAESLIRFELARVMHRLDPNHPRSAMQWLATTPPRCIFKLPDGRDLSYRVYGLPCAKPVLVFSAINTSTMADPLLANAAIRHGLKLIVIERPGLGRSTPCPNLSFESVAQDVACLASALGLKDVTIFASASATSFAIATAKTMRPAIARIGLYAPRLGPPQSDNQLGWGRMMRAFAQSDWMLDQVLRLFGAMMGQRQIASSFLSFAQTCPRDKMILTDMRLLDYLVVQLQDAMMGTPANAHAEIKLALSGAYVAPDTLTQPIAIWYGSANSAYSPADLDRDFKGLPNVQIGTMDGTGIQYGPEEANRMMRWLAEGGDA